MKAEDYDKHITIGEETYVLNTLNSSLLMQDADIDLGYDSYANYCRTQYAKHQAPDGFQTTRLDDLAATGLCRVQALPPEVCTELRAWVDREGGRVPLPSYDPAAIKRVLNHVFNPTVDGIIRNHYGAFYFVPFLNIFRTEPGMTEVSYCWHCDWGPRAHLKLFCYLGDPDSHNGSTTFLNRHSTDLLKRIGYVFGQSSSKRNVDIEPLCRRFGIPYDPQDLRPGEGEAALFEPASVIHKGVVPSIGYRYVLQVGIIPSPRPWDEMFDMCGGMLNVNESHFPDAHAIMQGMIKFKT